jgi:tetraacyldisaccharide 4'-kinase
MFANRLKILQAQGFRQKLIQKIENYLISPSSLGLGLSILLLPFSFIVCFIAIFKRFFAKPLTPPLPTVSIGNLTIGGSGKTPLTIALAKHYPHPAIVLRGYKRKSKGTICTSHQGKILCDVATSGDEAMLYANSLPNATVVVSEDRVLGIQKAFEYGAKCVFLDDGFTKFHIQKFDILIRPNPVPKLPFCLPSGPYRAPLFFEKYADLVLEEGKDFKREVTIKNPTKRMVLVTAIANPKRLKPYLPTDLIALYMYEDHYTFTKSELNEITLKHNATSLLVTSKDAVKIENFGLPLSLLNLDLQVNNQIHQAVKKYLTLA